MLNKKQIDECSQGLDQLQKPILPLVRLVQMLYLTGPFDTFAPLLDEFSEPVETGGVSYKKPGTLLRPYLDLLEIFERIKMPRSPARILLNEQLEPMDPLDALDSWVAQEVINRELESINSQLCRPCNCTLCCVGPDDTLNQDFFEIPLQPEEASLFELNRIDSPETRLTTSHSEPPLLRNNRPFYQTQSALYHWRSGWSLILPRASCCPNLDPVSGGCLIYPQRPDVCRRPQIFSYVLERQPDLDRDIEGKSLPAFVARKKLLAVWDCPYVQEFQEEIGRYAEQCELEPVFRKNKE
ncbi:MAG: YkgJ family cysteine cluster protein [Thermodesulfobacteriota bacterium]|nr:YkgJ family cysteine cluster protein [Thermodesulfobacteriota bacterium]